MKKYLRCKKSVIYQVVLEPSCNEEKIIYASRMKDLAIAVLEHYLLDLKYQDLALRKVEQTRYTLVED